MVTDRERLARYVDGDDQAAFGELVASHLDLVYGSARRQLRNAALAEDVTQVVFQMLAQKAASLRPDVVLPGWLMSATWYACRNALRKERRRRLHERAAASMRDETTTASSAVGAAAQQEREAAQLLDRALHAMGATDRAAVVMHYLQGRDYGEVAAALDTTPEAARKRIARAVTRLRDRFARAGVEFATPALLGTWLTGAAAATKAPSALLGIIAGGGGQLAACGASATTAAETLRTMAFAAKAKAACAVVILAAAASVGAVVAATSGARNPRGATVATPVAAAANRPATAPSPLVAAERGASADAPAGQDSVTFANALLTPNPDTNTTDYLFGLDPAVKRQQGGAAAAFIASATPAAKAGPIRGIQRHIAEAAQGWRGKRVEVSMYLRTRDVTGSAGVEVVVWGANGKFMTGAVAFGAPLRIDGTHEWQRVAAVLDVPPDAQRIEFAIGLWGQGRVWIDGVTVQSVAQSVPVTNDPLWHLTTQFPWKYRLAGDSSQPRNGHATARIVSSDPGRAAAGSRGDAARLLRVEVAVDKWRGKRVRVSAMMKSDELIGGAGVFASAGQFDRDRRLRHKEAMPSLPVTGTSGWLRYATVLAVPREADLLAYGVYFEGTGTLWVDDVTLEVLP